MKIKPEDFAALRAALGPFDTPERRERYRTGNFPNAAAVRDSNKRYRWDILYASGIRIGDGRGMQGDIDLYAYMDDTHIDTALRAIIPPL